MELRITNKQVNKIFNEDGDLDREEVELKCKTQVMASQFPELSPPDNYIITHTLVYEEF